MQTNRPLFITGKAGTGKTTFLRKLREQSPKNMAVVAPMSELQPLMEKPAKKTKTHKESKSRKSSTPHRPAKN